MRFALSRAVANNRIHLRVLFLKANLFLCAPFISSMKATSADVVAFLHASDLPAAVKSLSRVTDAVLLSRALLRQPWYTPLSRDIGGPELFSKLKPHERRQLVRLRWRLPFQLF